MPAKGDLQLKLTDLSKTYRRANGQLVHAIDNVSLDVKRGELVVLLGPSGCGKTTLLRCVAGLEQPDSGVISLDGDDVFDAAHKVEVPPERRHIGMVFQSYALWPHMTVGQNVGYPLKMSGLGRGDIDDKVARILELMRIPELGGQYPGQISGGQQQRVALARALVRGDNLILFDEPLSNVDAKVREHLRLELLSMQRELGFTALYVTHDQEEAMSLATRIAVVADGRISQLGTPQEVYFSPNSLNVARFIGSANQIDGRVLAAGTTPAVETPLGTIELPAGAVPAAERIALVSRPERWEIATAPLEGGLSWKGRIRASAFLGSHNEYLVDLNDKHDIQIWQQGSELLPIGTQVWCRVKADAFCVFDIDAEHP